MHVTRRRCISLAAAAILTSSVARSRAAAATTIVHVGTQPAEFSSDLFFGIDTGIFRSHDLAIDLQFLSNGAQTSAAIIGGSIEVGLVDPLSTALAHVHGLDLVYIAPGCGYTDPAPMALVTRAGTGEISAKDLTDKTIGTVSLKNAPQLLAFYWIDHNGGDSKAVKWIEMPFAASLGAIEEKRIDGALLPDPLLVEARKRGFQVTYLRHNELTTRWMVNGWAATRTWADANGALVKRFASAMLEANQWGNAHPVDAYPIITKYTKFPDTLLSAMTKHPWIERLSVPLVQPILDAAYHYGVLSQEVRAADLFYAPATT